MRLIIEDDCKLSSDFKTWIEENVEPSWVTYEEDSGLYSIKYILNTIEEQSTIKFFRLDFNTLEELEEQRVDYIKINF
jgi:hypothetical protein